MNRKAIIPLSILFILSSLLLLSATKDEKKKGFGVNTFEKSFKYIPAGSYMLEDSFMTGYKKESKIVSVAAFYICNHVVSNQEYRLFLGDLKSSNPQQYVKMLPDTLVWRNKSGYMEDMVKYYFNHPSYQDYPVIGVSHEQAEYYCKWLTVQYMKDPKRKYKNVVFKLPTLYQWEWAASGGLALSSFPWSGPYLINFNKKYAGQSMANYMHASECSIKREGDTGKLVLTNTGFMYGDVAGNLNVAADITTPVISYWPNRYGLYNMAGNVEEYIAEVGIAKGGSWHDPAYYLQIWAEKPYKNAQAVSDGRGFRVAMEVVK